MYHFQKVFSNFALEMAKKQIKLDDKTFELAIPEATILEAVKGVAERLKADYRDKNPVFVVVLSGAFIFASDLFRFVDYPCQFSFVKLASYEGGASSGIVSEQLAVDDMVRGRHVVVVEDIVEKGLTMDFLLHRIRERHPASVEICALSAKPEKLEVPGLQIKYVGMTLPEAFIVGYGLDYNDQGRHLRDIYSLV